MTNATAQPQTSFDEERLDDPELIEIIGDYLAAKDAAKGPAKALRSVKQTMTALLDQLELPPGTYRAGEYVVKKSVSGEKEISFERSSSHRYNVAQAKTK